VITARELRAHFGPRQSGSQRSPRTLKALLGARHVGNQASDLGNCLCGEPVVLHRDTDTNASISCEDLAILLAVAAQRIRGAH